MFVQSRKFESTVKRSSCVRPPTKQTKDVTIFDLAIAKDIELTTALSTSTLAHLWCTFVLAKVERIINRKIPNRVQAFVHEFFFKLDIWSFIIVSRENSLFFDNFSCSLRVDSKKIYKKSVGLEKYPGISYVAL